MGLVTLAGSGSLYRGYSYPGPGGGGGSGDYVLRAPTGSDKFVDFTAGSDGTGSEASPYNTMNITRWRALTAGQALWIMNGVGNGAYTPIVMTSLNAGNSSNRVIVACYPGHTPTRFNFPDVGTSWGTVYWDFWGIDLRSAQNGPRLGYQSWSGVGGNPDVVSNYTRFIDCIGTQTNTGYTDNCGLIAGNSGSQGPNNQAIGIEIVRCVFSGPTNLSNNQALIWFDYPDQLKIIGCDLNGSSHPIYYKHVDRTDDTGNVIKNCIFRNGYSGTAIKLCVNYLQFINNAVASPVLYGCDEGGNAVSPGTNWFVSHNTFSNCDYVLDPGSNSNGPSVNGDNVLMDNVWAGTSRFEDNPSGTYSNLDQGNVSDYSACEGTGTNHFYRNGSQRTLAQHKSAFATQEVNGLASTLTFAGTLNATPSNWQITAGTSALGNSSDAVDRGVDYTKLLTVD